MIAGGLLSLAALPAAGQTAAYKAPRTADGKPDLNGIWQVLNTANWDLQSHAAGPGLVVALGAAAAIPPGQGVVEGDQIPYLPAAAAKKKANFDNRLTLDPEVKCYMPGVPRATYMPFPFQIVQSTKFIMIAYEYANATRTIYMEDPGPSPIDSWMGQSVGHWEGDTLVVDVKSLNDQTWFDRAGDFHSDALHVVERYTRTGPGVLTYEATIEDPKRVFAALEDHHAYLSPSGEERPVDGLQVRGVRRRVALRQISQAARQVSVQRKLRG
jgi:hypothetical protein